MIRLDISRRGGLFSMLGSLLWIVSWVLVMLAGGGRSRGEPIWRTVLLNPAILLLMAGLAAFHARQAGRSGRLGKSGFAVCLLGTGTMLLGNVVEFWVSEHPGWVMIGVGAMMLPVGFVLLGLGTLRGKVFTGWRRTVPLAFGLLLAAMKLISVLGAHYWLLDRSDGWGIPLGWMALGYALWSEKTNSSDSQILARVETTVRY